MADLRDILQLGRLGGQYGNYRPRSRRRDPLDEFATPEEAVWDAIRAAPAEPLGEGPAGGFETALAALDAPRNLFANLVNLITQVEPSSKRKGLFGLPQIGAQDFIRAASGGRDPETTLGKIAQGLGGFVGDVALDPLTYLTFGTGSILGNAAKRAGGVTLTKAGGEALKTAERTHLADLIRKYRRTGVTGREAGRSARGRLRALYERAGTAAERKALRATLPAAEAAERIAQPLTPLAAEFAQERGKEAVRGALARRLAKAAPDLVDRNVLGVSTRPAKEFGLLDIPAAIVGGTLALTKATDTLAKVAPVFAKVRPFTQPLRWLPAAEKTLIKSGPGSLVERLGLGKLGTAAKAAAAGSHLGRAIGEIASETGRELRKRFWPDVLPPRANDPNDQLRYETESLEQFIKERTAQRMRQVAGQEVRKLRGMVSKITKAHGLPDAAAGELVYTIAERRPSVEAGGDDARNVVEAVRSIFRRYGLKDDALGDAVQAIDRKIVDLMPGAPGPATPRPQRAKQYVFDALRGMGFTRERSIAGGAVWRHPEAGMTVRIAPQPLPKTAGVKVDEELVLPSVGDAREVDDERVDAWLEGVRDLVDGLGASAGPARGDADTVSDSLRALVAEVLPDVPRGQRTRRKHAEAVRAALFARADAGELKRALTAPAGSREALAEVDRAVRAVERGGRIFDRMPADRAAGSRVTMVDGELNEYEGTVELVDLDELTASHRPKRVEGRVRAVEANPDYPEGFQARSRESDASVAQIEAIASKPKPKLLVEFGPDVTGGPPVVWRDPDSGRLVVIQGNGRTAGMAAWQAEQWQQYRGALAAAGYDVGELARPVLVRRLEGTGDEARQLAALGQTAATLRQTRIERARAALNALNVKNVDQVPPVRVPEPVTPENARKIIDAPENSAFKRWLIGNLDGGRQAQILEQPHELAERMNDVFLALLPARVRELAATAPEKIERMFVAAAPAAAWMRSLIRDGVVRPEYDLYEALEQAADFYKNMRASRGSFTKMVDDLDRLADTPTLPGFEDPLQQAGSARAVALAVGMVRATRAADPERTLREAVDRVVAAARADDPRQVSMFGEVDGAQNATDAFLWGMLPPKTAGELAKRLKTVEGGAAAAAGAAREAAEVPPIPPAPPPAATADERPEWRRLVYEDLRGIWTKRNRPAEEFDAVARVLDRFHDDAFTGLRVQRGSAAEGKQLGASAVYRTAADPEKAAELAALNARGIIKLFSRANRYDDFELFLHELGHHLYRSVMGDDERGVVRAWFEARKPAEWEATVKARKLGGKHAKHFAAADPDAPGNELWARYFADYVMGREVAGATPEVKSIFARAWDTLAKLWRDLVGSGAIGTDPRIAALIERWYQPPAIARENLKRKVGAGLLDEPVAPIRGTQEPFEFARPEPPRPPASDAPVDPVRGEQLPLGLRAKPKYPGTHELRLSDPIREMVDYLQARSHQRVASEKAAHVPSAALRTERAIGYLTRLTAEQWDPQAPVSALEQLRRSLLKDGGAKAGAEGAAPQRTWREAVGYALDWIIGGAKTRMGALQRKASMTLRSKFQRARLEGLREKFTDELNGLIGQMNDVLAGRGSSSRDAAKMVEALGLKPGDALPTFYMDPVLSHVAREMESARVIGSAAFLEETMRRYGVRVDKGPPPAGYSMIQGGKFGDLAREFAVPDAVAHVLQKHVSQLVEPDRLLRAYRSVLNLWKGTALLSPAYHLRNLWGNVWNSMIVDGFSLEGITEARQIQRAFSAGDAKALDQRVKGTKYTRNELHRELSETYAAIGSGFYGTEFSVQGERVRDMLERMDDPAGARRALKELGGLHLLRANRTIGEVVEEASRIGLVITRLRKGDSLPEAVKTMERALFDYSDLTTFEKGAVDRLGVRDVIPFYTWMRKNAELLLLTAMHEPRRLAMVPKIQLNVETAAAGEDVLPESFRPDFIRKEGGVQISGGPRPNFLNLGYALPIGEMKLNPLRPKDAARYLMEQAGGPLRTGVELVTNYDTFFDRPIRDYEGQRKPFLGVPLPPEVTHVLRTIRPLNQIEQIRRTVENSATPLGATAAATAQLAGVRAFSVDPTRQVLEQERKINTQISAVRRDFRRRASQLQQTGGNPLQDPEFVRLLRLHEDLRTKRDALPGSEVRSVMNRLSKGRREKLQTMIEQYRAGAGAN